MDVEAYVSLDNPYSYHGARDSWNEEELRNAFTNSGIVEVMTERRMTIIEHRMPQPIAERRMTSAFPSSYALPDDLRPSSDDVTLKITKVGLLSRRDALLEGGKRAPTRKWKEWSVILTGSQLLLFRDRIWATHLQEQVASGASQIFLPPASLLKPDDLFPIKDTIAVYDKSYTDVSITSIYQRSVAHAVAV